MEFVRGCCGGHFMPATKLFLAEPPTPNQPTNLDQLPTDSPVRSTSGSISDGNARLSWSASSMTDMARSPANSGAMSCRGDDSSLGNPISSLLPAPSSSSSSAPPAATASKTENEPIFPPPAPPPFLPRPPPPLPPRLPLPRGSSSSSPPPSSPAAWLPPGVPSSISWASTTRSDKSLGSGLAGALGRQHAHQLSLFVVGVASRGCAFVSFYLSGLGLRAHLNPARPHAPTCSSGRTGPFRGAHAATGQPPGSPRARVMGMGAAWRVRLPARDAALAGLARSWGFVG